MANTRIIFLADQPGWANVRPPGVNTIATVYMGPTAGGGGGGGGPTNVSGNVSGTWTTAGSPYLVTDNISLLSGSTLTIDPGVSVEFQGYYWFKIYGNITAVGTSGSRIVFTTKTTDRVVAEGGTKTTASWVGWRGIRIDGAEYTPTQLQHKSGAFNFQFVDIDYVDKHPSESGDSHPWKETIGSIYGHGFYWDDLILNDVRIHHQRSDAFALYPGNYDFGTNNVYYYRNEVFYSDNTLDDLGSAVDIAHYQRSVAGDVSVHFVSGGAYNITTPPASTTPHVAYSWDTDVRLDGYTISNCGAPAEYFLAVNAGANVSWSAP